MLNRVTAQQLGQGSAGGIAIFNSKSKGFTLIELVMVIILIGIIAVFTAPMLSNVSTLTAGAFADKLRADIRYAQSLAMSGNDRVRVYFNGTGGGGVTAPAAGYAVAYDSSSANNCSSFAPVVDPSGSGNLTVTLMSGTFANISVTPTTACLEYDTLGRPYDCSGNLASCTTTASTSNITVTINPNGSITITAQTGAVN
ncbi:MAG TPA: prepilin-type N-terminal cleavage/methylation domain-containing protein [Nitrospirota bacterium]|nr:prepilin-type N-terminal cleavage/methylation domain-containing protein [Nitrospirota bacterium]